MRSSRNGRCTSSALNRLVYFSEGERSVITTSGPQSLIWLDANDAPALILETLLL